MFEALKRSLKNWQYEIGIFAVLMVSFLNNLEPIGRWYPASYFLFSYESFGFVNRAFIGSIVRFLSSLGSGGGEVFISKAFIWYFLVFSWILCFVLISFLLGRFIRAAQEKNFLFAIGMVIVYLASPFSVASLFQEYFYLSPNYPRDIGALVYHNAGGLGQIDFYGLMFLLLIVWLLALRKESIAQLFIPILCFCVTITHVAGSFTFLPTISILLFYNAYKNNFSKSSLSLFIVSFIVMLCASIYLRLIAAPPHFEYQTLSDIYEKLLIKTDFPVDIVDFDYWFQSTYLMSPKQMFLIFLLPLFPIFLSRLFSTLFLSSPFIILWILFWRKIIKRESNKFLKIIFIFSSIILFVSTSILFFVMQDYGRILFYFFSTQFILACFFFHKGEVAIVKTAEEAVAWAKNHIFIVSILIVYLLTLGKTTFGLTFPMFFYMKEIVLNLIS
jgi:hypothetical protein